MRPLSTRRQMSSESPLGFKILLGHEEQPPEMPGKVAADYDDFSLAQNCGSLLFSPPRSILVTESGADNQESQVPKDSCGNDDMLAEYADEKTTLHVTVVLDVGIDVGELEAEAVEAEKAVACVLTACEFTDNAAVDSRQRNAQVSVTADSTIA